MNAISVKQLGKKFKLFPSPAKRFLEYLTASKLKYHTDFWALKDITFEIPAGTTLGILGQNGSGKSTLLSILAGVLFPSEGSFKINGKVSAILELGSGFHPEFSGRDNVYMYGSIMGLSKQEIDDRFDEIIQFSELGDFLDQPLRTYSTGMIVRLAFSVAVNVNADILIVDEALAVGDAIFQHRCFRKIREMQESGKTILYVGHDTDIVRGLCTSALLLDGGCIIARGDSNTVVNKYYALITDREQAYTEEALTEHGEVLSGDYETVYDFIRNLPEAKIESAKGIPVQTQTVEIQSIPRRVIFAHPPSRITYTVLIESGTSLAFAIGILSTAWEKIPQGVKFDIWVDYDTMVENPFSRVLQPKRNIGDRGWHNFIINLEKFSGKSVSISYSTSGSGDDLSYCWAAWGNIKLIRNYHSQNTLSLDVKKERPSVTDEMDSIGSSDFKIRSGNKKAEIIKVSLLNEYGKESFSFKSGDFAVIVIQIRMNQDFSEKITVGCNIKNRYTYIYGTNTSLEDLDLNNKKNGEQSLVKFSIRLILTEGLYSITAGCAVVRSDGDVEVLDRLYDCVYFKVNNDKKIIGFVDLHASVEVY